MIGRYRHYTGRIYEVIAVGKETGTKEDYVCFRPVIKCEGIDDPVWMQPLSRFLETVEHNGKQVPRFTRL